ncbi:MAG TPA: PKD domain-containing protein [Thermoplasmata archaeon]|nr:PKD domain-containing protein [Thermoplasmata archaeon]
MRHRFRTSLPGRTWAIALVALTAVGVPGAWVLPAHHAVPPTVGLRAYGAAFAHDQLEQARQSLVGPDRAHGSAPSVLISPGGFEWTNLTPQLTASPAARWGEALAWDPADGYVLLFGGSSLSTMFGDTWSFSDGTWTNLTGTVTGSPPPRLVYADLAFDPSDQEMILFGGEIGSLNVLRDTWSYHGGLWTNLTGHTGLTPPLALESTMSTDSSASDVVLFGGANPITNVWNQQTWTFKSGTWTNITASANAPPGMLFRPTSTDDPSVGGVALLAPYLTSGIGWATLTFSNGTWHNLSALVSGPPVRILGAGAGYLAPISAAAFVSGSVISSTSYQQYRADSFELAGDVWSNVTSVTGGPPSAGEYGAGSDLPNDQGLLIFGGINQTIAFGSTWVLTAPPRASISVAHVVTDVGAADGFASSVVGGYGAYVYRWAFGDGLGSAVAAPAHTFSRAGVYAVNLSVTDLLGHSTNASISVEVNTGIAVSAEASPSPATAGSSMALLGSFTGGTGPFTFSWTLGDANTSSAASLAHIYRKAGNYSVSFTVTDSLGQSATQGLTLEVQSAPSTGGTGSASGSSSVSLTSGTGLYLVLGIVMLAVVAGVLGAMLARRPKSPPGPPTAYPAPASGPPPPSGAS